ncbi:MAG: mannose-6-phosphate isomerase, partial [Burkholderiales bacterium]|nr:mannose-6-phosphate isomerase [Opitutaceae bacterium]
MTTPAYLPSLGLRAPNYDKLPAVAVPRAHAASLSAGWPAIAATLRAALAEKPSRLLAVECYPCTHDDDIREKLGCALGTSTALGAAPAFVLDTKSVFKTPAEIDALVAPDLGGNDPVFGRISSLRIEQFLDAAKLAAARETIRAAISADASPGFILVVGPAAALVAPADALLVFADMPRWEGQLRQRRATVDNLGVRNRGLKASLQYKRAFFIDWRVADRLKRATMARWDFLLDTTADAAPKLIPGAAHLAGLAAAAARPFRVVPFFDPGPWGGQ